MWCLRDGDVHVCVCERGCLISRWAACVQVEQLATAKTLAEEEGVSLRSQLTECEEELRCAA